MKSQNSEHRYITDQWPYPYQDQDAKHQWGATSILQSPKLGLEVNGYSLHFQQSRWSAKLQNIGIHETCDQDQDWKPLSGTFSILQIPKSGLNDKDILCTFKIKIERKKLENWSTKDHWPYSNQDQHTKPQSGTTNILQIPKSGL